MGQENVGGIDGSIQVPKHGSSLPAVVSLDDVPQQVVISLVEVKTRMGCFARERYGGVVSKIKFEFKPVESDPIRNVAVVPYKWYAKFVQPEVVPEMYCEDDRLYFIDQDGDVHYFKYLGKNICSVDRGIE